MTVESVLNRKEYEGNGATVAFATNPVVFFDEGDLTVYVVVDATGVATEKTITTHYTVSGGDGAVGTVTMLTAPAIGETLVIVRDLDIVQEADFVQNDSSDAEVFEDAIDKITMILQQLDARLDRSFVLGDGDTSGASTTLPTPTASQLIGWNADGDALQNYSAIALDLALTTSYILTLLDDETAAEARTTLGAAGDAATTAALALKAPLASPTFTGVVAIPDGSAAAPALKVGDEQNGLYSSAANELAAAVAGANAWTLSATGLAIAKLLDLSAAAAGQIKFPAAQNASANANTLDDYEEGTWTPAFTFATPGNVAVTYTSQTGSYTKIGRVVHALFDITASSFTHTTAAGAASITGLPFACQSSFTPGALMWQGITKANYTNYALQASNGSSALEIIGSGSGQAVVGVSTADMPSGTAFLFRGSVTYMV